MTVATLFETKERTDASPVRAHESKFQFYDRVAGPFWERIRNQINRMLSDYPTEDRSRMIHEMRGSTAMFDAAWWELLLHALLRSQGAKMRIHPEVAGTRRRPDFLVEGLTGGPFLLEAKVLEDDAGTQTADGVSYRIWEGVHERLSIRNAMLSIEIAVQGQGECPVRALAVSIDRWLEPWADQVGGRPDQLRWHHNNSGWGIDVDAIIMDFIPERPMGMPPTSGGFVANATAAMRGAVETKYRRYGSDPGLPLVVAVHTRRFGGDHPDDGDVMNMLAGVAVSPVQRDGSIGPTFRRRNGIWIRGEESRGGRMTGLLIARKALPTHLNQTQMQLWHNPSPDRSHPLPLPFATHIHLDPKPNPTSKPTNDSVAEVLGLGPDWPGPEAPFPHRSDG